MQYARLATFNGKQNVLRSFTVFGIKFREQNGWYEVEDDVAEYLKKCTQVQEDPTSAPAFHVCRSLEEANEIDELEKKRAERAAAKDAHATAGKRVHQTTARNRPPSNDLTTEDLRKAPEGRRSKGFDEMSDKFDDDMAGKSKPVTPVLDGADEDEETSAVEDTEEEEADDEESDADVEESEGEEAPAAPAAANLRGRGRGKQRSR